MASASTRRSADALEEASSALRAAMEEARMLSALTPTEQAAVLAALQGMVRGLRE